ncbi:twin-arginine translocation signal domain-containing protein [Halarchaeum nitratireducens]|uniref:Uncharacterized protein n=1 Tax=Halarchaeum nitratireducens TaxID=489913 RepID=A0A830GA49_9EURY|nr:twin-arginine translocation signal domain-containing protein [Halarchaeum nitratireducens]GGN09911.1 hypothetical protein GCM10009021_06990 [Halarchaeum nitratireducens]
MTQRRTFLKTVGLAAGTALAGYGASESNAVGDASAQESSGDAPLTSVEQAVPYQRNVEEVKGHLEASAHLLSESDGAGDAADGATAAFHAKHAGDYYKDIIPRLRDADSQLALQLRATLADVLEHCRSMDSGAYDDYVHDDVFSLLDRASAAVISEDLRGTTSFTGRVMNALARRLNEEYSVGVATDGETITNAGEYWDAWGFAVRIQTLYDGNESAFLNATSDAVSAIRGQVEDTVSNMAVRETTLQLRASAEGALGLPSASVEGREDALDYARNVEEVKGHLLAASELKQLGDSSGTAFHARHAPDYAMTVLPPLYASDPGLAGDVLTRMTSALERGHSLGADAFDDYATGETFDLLDDAMETAVSEEFRGTTPFTASIIVALAGRIEEEYSAAVPEGEAVDLYGEYWDARGFLRRVETHYAAIESDLDAETRDAAGTAVETLRTNVDTVSTADELSGTVSDLESALSSVAGGN